MDEGRRNEHSGAKMPREEEEVMGYGEFGEAADNDWEGASCWPSVGKRNNASTTTKLQSRTHTGRAQSENQDQCKYVEWRVVRASAALGPAIRPCFLLPSTELIVEDMCWNVAP